MSGHQNGRDRRDNHNYRQNQRSKKRKHRESDHGSDQAELPLLQPPALPKFNLTDGEQPLNQPVESSVKVEASNSTSEGPPSKKPKKIPKKDTSNYPSISFSSDARLQSMIKISDLQGLILYLLTDATSPQWIAVRHRPEIRKVVVLMVPGLEMHDFKQSSVDGSTVNSSDPDKNGWQTVKNGQNTSPDEYYPTQLKSEVLPAQTAVFADMFEHLWPVRTPGDDKYGKMHSPLFAMLSAPVGKAKDDKEKTKKGPRNIRTPITEYIATTENLAENEYVLHPAALMDEDEQRQLASKRQADKTAKEHGWVDTKVETYAEGTPADAEVQQGSLTAGREVFAMDCEMVLTGENESALTRISIVRWDGAVVMDELVKPEKPITDYLTRFSGMTKDMLDPVTTTLKDIQQKLVGILHPKTILVGHSLNSDLTALKMTHPYVVDTALLYPHPRGPPLKSSLKYLAQKYLGKEIQKGDGLVGKGAGHDSIEDARTCLDLVKQKCEKGPQHGTSEAVHENLYRRLARAGVSYKRQGDGLKDGKTTAAVDWGNPKLGPGSAANVTIGCGSDDDVVDGVIRAVMGDPDGLEVPGGGVDFVWARMRELEALRGWWNNNRVVQPQPTETTSSSTTDAAAAAIQDIAVPILTSTEEAETSVVEAETSNAVQAEIHGSAILATPQAVADSAAPISQPVTNPEPTSTPADLSTEIVEPNPVSATHPDIETEAPDILNPTIPSPTDPTASAITLLSQRLKRIYDSLPPCTAFVIYTGSGDPREMSKLQQMQQTFKREYKTKKWDELSVKWTDTEEQALKRAAKKARLGLGFVCVK